MAATTISRATLTDGVSVWNAALVGTAIYDKIDALIAGAVTFGGVVSSEGFGVHTFSTGGTGRNALFVRNTSAGTGNYAEVQVWNDASKGLQLRAFSTTWTTSAQNVQDGCSVDSTGVGGLSLAASHASGTVRVYSGGTTQRTEWDAAGGITHAHGLTMTGVADRTLSSSTSITDLSTAMWAVRITSGSATPKLSAISAAEGRTYFIVNASGADFDIEHEYTGATSTSRIYGPNSANVTMKPNDCALLWYDNTTQRWRVLARGL